MNEEFLHYIWKFKNFSFGDLKTTHGKPVKLIRTGEHNNDAGPDFINAQVLIEDVRWAGSVEIHIKASDWDLHGHSSDRAYDNVVLHVVYEDDIQNNSKIPVLELKEYISDATIENYGFLKRSQGYIPCESLLHRADSFTRSLWIERITVERFESRLAGIRMNAEATQYDWREIFYQSVARSYGFKVNSDAFERLAETLPMRVLARHSNNLTLIEALLYGQAGFLDEGYKDEYPNILKKEFAFLKQKYKLQPIERSRWKFLRMRPDNFPTIRIAQFARLVHDSENLFSKILEVNEIYKLEELFATVASDYWDTHFVFDKEAANEYTKIMGKGSIEKILINTVAPMIYAYGHLRGEATYKDKALQLLEQISEEKNSITRGMQERGFDNANALDSQGLLQLKKEYCDRRRCIECGIGIKVLKQATA